MLKLFIIPFLSLFISLISFGQLSIGEKYLSLTVDSGYLKINKRHHFTLCDYLAKKTYTGEWSLKNDSLFLKFSSSRSLMTETKENDDHMEKFIISGPRIESIPAPTLERRSYIAKSHWDVILKQQVYVIKRRKMRAK